MASASDYDVNIIGYIPPARDDFQPGEFAPSHGL